MYPPGSELKQWDQLDQTDCSDNRMIHWERLFGHLIKYVAHQQSTHSPLHVTLNMF